MRESDKVTGSRFSYVDPYEGSGRSSIAPEKLLRASLLQAIYSVRSERQLVEQIDYKLLFGWFVGLGIDDPVLGPLDVLQELRTAARGRRCREVPRSGLAPPVFEMVPV